MTLQNTYVFGNLLMAYEWKMLDEHLRSCLNMLSGIDNKENITFHYCINFQEYLETYENPVEINGYICEAMQQFAKAICPAKLITEWKIGPTRRIVNGEISEFYNIAKYRRDLCWNWCEKVDFVCWSETDSLWPKQTLEVIDSVHSMVKDHTPKYVLSFGYRLNWDKSWAPTVHPLFQNVQFQDNDDWTLNNEASEKSYMTLERMNEINDIDLSAVEVDELREPKADGSCLVITSELLKSGVVIPPALIHSGEDESLMRSAKMVMGDNFVQFVVRNVLRVHNRRHPNKRSGIVGEDNPRGFCDSRKGDWWTKLENSSKFNLENLRTQRRFNKIEDVI